MEIPAFTNITNMSCYIYKYEVLNVLRSFSKCIFGKSLYLNQTESNFKFISLRQRVHSEVVLWQTSLDDSYAD